MFKDGRLEKCYGREQPGTPISIGYDTKSKNYISLGGRTSSGEHTIYEAIASQTKGRHSAGELIKIHYDEARAIVLPAQETSSSSQVARSKPPTSTPDSLEPVDYSLLLMAKSKQEEIQLNRETTEYLKQFFAIAERHTLSARISERSIEERAGLLDPDSAKATILQPKVSRQISFTNNAYAPSLAIPVYGAPIDLSWISDATLLRAALPLVRLATPIGGLATAIGLELHSSQRYASDLQKYTDLASGNSQNVTITPTDIALANARGVFDVSNPNDLEALMNVARGIAIERSTNSTSSQLVPIWSAKKPINFRVMGALSNQSIDRLISSYTTIDPDANKPQILWTPEVRPESSILYTPPSDQYRFVLPGYIQIADELARGTTLITPDHSDWASLMSTLYKKLYPDSVEKINDRYPINADFAGQKFPLDKLPEHIREKYPDSVMFDEQGFARFEPYTYVDETGKLYRVELDIITGGEKDIDYANKAMGVTDTPEGHMWHHIEHTKIVIAVPKDIHEAVRHTGGRATNKAGSKK